MSLRRARARRASWLPLAIALLFAIPGGPARGADEPAIPAPTGYVNDHAGVMDEAARARLESFLDQVEKKTGAQFAVLVVKTTAPLTAAEYKVKVFDQWKIGKKGEDNGLLLLVATDDHEARFETGYGLEGTLPDGWQARMLRDLAVPEFRKGDPAAGITAAVLAASQRIAAEKGVKLEWNGKELRYNEGSDGIPNWVFMLILFVLFFVVFPALSARSRRRGGWYSPGGWGGWGGGFGGFGGGFGGGGGGGGSSFGGFGGGSSGGGGGGAHW